MRAFIYRSGIKFLLLFFLSVAVYGQERLSSRAQVSLLSCEPGDALYEAFGHSALRVYDPLSNIDLVYNYGRFDFNQPNFYLNFTRGNLRYMLGTNDLQRFLYGYTYYNRSVHEQVLNLREDQKQAVFDFLQHNRLPENREYYYDYFFDNCATRPRDVIIKVLGDSLQFDYGYADSLHYSIRDLTDRYIKDSPKYAWGDFGIDLGLGAGIDRKASPFEYMYQPEFLALAFENATVLQPDGSKQPLVAATHTLFKGRDRAEAAQEGSLFTPAVVFWLLFIVSGLVSLVELRQRKYRFALFDLLFFGAMGLTGSLIVFLWFFTNHTAAASNWNLAWAWPTHLPLAFMLLARRRPAWLNLYFMAAAICTALVLLCWTVIPQDLHEALLPLLLLLIVRCGIILYTGNSDSGQERASASEAVATGGLTIKRPGKAGEELVRN